MMTMMMMMLMITIIKFVIVTKPIKLYIATEIESSIGCESLMTKILMRSTSDECAKR